MLSAGADGSPIEVCYSGGKDSDVILRLTQLSGVPYRAIYKNTTIDPPGTIAHCKANGVEILNPKRSFLDIVRAKGMPSRWTRFCCAELKEYKVLDYAVQGIRREESVKRARLYKEPIVCRMYNKKDHVNVAFPILEWTLEDVKSFIEAENITLAPKYYDEEGNCHYNRRLGCIGCPLSGKGKIADYKRYPKQLRQVVKAMQTFRETHPNSCAATKFKDVYQQVYTNLFIGGSLTENEPTLFDKPDYKAFLQNYFNIDLD